MKLNQSLLAALSGLGFLACTAPTDLQVSQDQSDLTSNAVTGDEAAASSEKFIDKAGARPGEFLVVMHPQETVSSRQQLVASYNATVFRTYNTVIQGFAARMTDADARRLAANPAVKYVERNGIKRIIGSQSNATWGIDRVDQVDLPLDRQYSYSLTGKGVNAVVIDTGVDAKQPDFGGRVVRGFNALQTGSVDDASDVHGHGTHVAGTIASQTWGLAKEATIIPVRVCDSRGECTDADIVEAVEWVTANVALPAVVNMSLGGGIDEKTQATEDAIRASIQKGIAYVVAAGNDSADACRYSPARIPEVITTGSTTRSDGRSSFSNYGKCVDIFAPGSNIVSARRGSGSMTMSGTSMASPHAAGVAALLLEKNPTATPEALTKLVLANGTPNKVTNPGAGSPNLLLHLAP